MLKIEIIRLEGSFFFPQQLDTIVGNVKSAIATITTNQLPVVREGKGWEGRSRKGL